MIRIESRRVRKGKKTPNQIIFNIPRSSIKSESAPVPKVNLLQVKEKRHKENNMGNIREQSPPFPSPQGRVSGF